MKIAHYLGFWDWALNILSNIYPSWHFIFPLLKAFYEKKI